MLYLKLVLILVMVILWLVAPKIILQPPFSSHTYDIQVYVGRFRRSLLTLSAILFGVLALPVSPYVILILVTTILICCIPFLVDARGAYWRSAWHETVIQPWWMFLLERFVMLGATGLLVIYMTNKHVDIRFIEGLITNYLLWAFGPVIFMLLRKVFLDLSSLVPRAEATGLGCAVQVGALCVAGIVGVCLWLPWFWIIYMYLTLAYLGAFFLEVLNFIGDLQDG